MIFDRKVVSILDEGGNLVSRGGGNGPGSEPSKPPKAAEKKHHCLGHQKVSVDRVSRMANKKHLAEIEKVPLPFD